MRNCHLPCIWMLWMLMIVGCQPNQHNDTSTAIQKVRIPANDLQQTLKNLQARGFHCEDFANGLNVLIKHCQKQSADVNSDPEQNCSDSIWLEYADDHIQKIHAFYGCPPNQRP